MVLCLTLIARIVLLELKSRMPATLIDLSRLEVLALPVANLILGEKVFAKTQCVLS